MRSGATKATPAQVVAEGRRLRRGRRSPALVAGDPAARVGTTSAGVVDMTPTSVGRGGCSRVAVLASGGGVRRSVADGGRGLALRLGEGRSEERRGGEERKWQ